MDTDLRKYYSFGTCGGFVSETIKYVPQDSIKSESHDDAAPKVSYVMLTDAQDKNTTSTDKNKKERLPISEFLSKVILMIYFSAMCMSVAWMGFKESTACGLFTSCISALFFGMLLPLIVNDGNNASKNKETK